VRNRARDFLIALSCRWWSVALVVALNFAAFRVLFILEERFVAQTGTALFDTQNDLTVSRIIEQLPLYQGDARAAYYAFATFDFLFPLIAGIFLALIWTLLLRWNHHPGAHRLLSAGFPLLILLTTVWDWLENLSLLAIVALPASPPPAAMHAAILFKQLKLTWLFLSGPVTAALLLFLLINALQRGLRGLSSQAK
jgi:hypothetical protein